MARNTNIYSNHWVGSAGWGTSRQLRGQTIVSQKSLGPTNERTAIQIGNEKSMATLVAIGRLVLTGIRRAFNEMRVKNTPAKCANTAWGAYTGENRKYENFVFDYSIPDSPVFEPAQLIMARGTIEPTPMTTATADVSAQTVTLTYPTTALGAGQLSTDRINLFLYNVDKDTWFFISGGGARSEGTWTSASLAASVPFELTDEIRVYTFFAGAIIGGPTDDMVILTGKEEDSTNMIVTVGA